MPLNFPSNPTNGQTYTDNNSVVWQFDSVKWNVVTGTTKRLYMGVKVGFSTNYNLTDTMSAVTWDVESFDTDDYWTNAAPSRITIPSTGWYNLNTNIFTENAGADYMVSIRKNAVTDISSVTMGANQAADYNETVYFEAGDYIQLFASEATVAGSLTTGTYMELTLLGYAVGTGVTPYSAFSGAKTYLSTAFSTTTTPTAIAWSGTDWDTNANALALTYWTAGAPTRLTVQTNGFYQVSTFLETDTTGGIYTLTLKKNGTTDIATVTRSANDTAWLNQVYELAANDYLEVFVSDTLSSGAMTTETNIEIIRQGV